MDIDWRTIEGFGDYMVNPNGDVMRTGYMRKTKYNTVYYCEPHILKPATIKCGYLMVVLTDSNGKRKNMLVHRLVAKAYIPNPNNKPVINHIDGNKANNVISNLEWCTYTENQNHALSNGLKRYGCAHPQSLLTREQVEDIRGNCTPYKKGFRIVDFAKKYNVSPQCISGVVHSRNYKREK